MTSKRARIKIPNEQIIGLRNRVIHGYHTVDLDRLWQVMTTDLPTLATALDRILDSPS